MDDLAMTCSDFVDAPKMLIFSEKHPVSRANCGYTKKVVIDRTQNSELRILFNITMKIYKYNQ